MNVTLPDGSSLELPNGATVREAAAAIRLLLAPGGAALDELQAALQPQEGVSDDDIDHALQQLAAAA